MIDNEKIRHEIGLALFQERLAQRYSRPEVAESVEVNAKTIENIEKGLTKINLEMYLGLCSFYGKGISYFLPDEWKKIRKG